MPRIVNGILRSTWKAILFSSSIIVLLFVVYFFSGIGERYCHFWPTIGTVFARGYSEEAFDRVYVGMRSAEVLRSLGPPLSSETTPNGTIEWWYTEDKAGVFDFAWLGRTVTLSNDVVISKEKHVYFD